MILMLLMRLRVSLYHISKLFGIFGWGPGGLECNSDELQISFGLS